MLGFRINPWIGWCWCFFAPMFCAVCRFCYLFLSMDSIFVYYWFLITLHVRVFTKVAKAGIYWQNNNAAEFFVIILSTERICLFCYILMILLVYLHLQPCDLFAARVWLVRVSRMGHGHWLAVDSVIFIADSWCDDLQADEYHWHYFRGKQRRNWVSVNLRNSEKNKPTPLGYIVFAEIVWWAKQASWVSNESKQLSLP